MRIISRSAIREFCIEHPEGEAALDSWYRVVKQAVWESIVDVRKLYSHADAVGRFTVFNVRGNHYRLISEINYESQTVYIRFILTHKEYDQEGWKDGR